jgi:PAS domain S-box-containing protein
MCGGEQSRAFDRASTAPLQLNRDWPMDCSMDVANNVGGPVTGSDGKQTNEDSVALQESEAKYRGLLEAVPDPIVIVNPEEEIVLSNVQAEKQFGYSHDELLGKDVTAIIPRGYGELLAADPNANTPNTLTHHTGEGQELSGVRKDGSEFPIAMKLSPQESSDGVMVTAAIRDVSASKEAEEYSAELERRVEDRTRQLAASNQVLEQTNMELKQFVYIAYHDLQSPLRSLTGFIQLLKIKLDDKLDDEGADWLHRATQATVQMETLIRDLLTFSKVDSRARPFAMVPFRDVLNDAVDQLEPSIRDAAARVTCGQMPEVFGDRAQLVQLMENLIGNGLKYHGTDPPHVHVSAQRSQDRWTFSVRDNGIGIAPENAEKIFEIFQRLHHKTEYPGTGIGLAVCRRIVNRHGGRIWVNSSPSLGSTFHFTIPVGTEQRNGHQAEVAPTTNGSVSF